MQPLDAGPINPRTVEQLQTELAEAERIVARIREDLERAQWLRDYEETSA